MRTANPAERRLREWEWVAVAFAVVAFVAMFVVSVSATAIMILGRTSGIMTVLAVVLSVVADDRSDYPIRWEAVVLGFVFLFVVVLTTPVLMSAVMASHPSEYRLITNRMA